MDEILIYYTDSKEFNTKFTLNVKAINEINYQP